MEKNSYLVVLNNKNFRNLWLAQVTSQIAVNMLSFTLLIRVYQETRSNLSVSLLFLSFGIPAVIFGIISGGIVDYFDKRDILIICNITRVLIFIAFFLFSSQLLYLYILAVIFFLITQVFIPAEAPSIPNLVSSEYLLPANSLFTISFYLSTVFGFVASGPALRLFGSHGVFLVMAVLMLVASGLVYFLPKIEVIHKSANLNLVSIYSMIKEGIGFINKNIRIKSALILMTFAQVLIMVLSVLAPGFADRVLEIELTDSSYLVMGPAAVGLILGAFLVGSIGKRFLKSTLILGGIISTSAVLVFLSLLTGCSFCNFPHYLALFFALSCLLLLGFFNSFITVPANTILQEDTVGNMRGRIYGVFTSASGGISILPVVFSGIMADVAGTGTTLFFIGVLIFIIGIYFYKRRKNHAILSTI